MSTEPAPGATPSGGAKSRGRESQRDAHEAKTNA